MAYSYKIPIKKNNIEDYNQLAAHALELFSNLSHSGDEIHLIFDNYNSDSIKKRRAEKESSWGKQKKRLVIYFK